MLKLANPAPIRSVHLQQANRSSAYRSASDNDDSVALKVLIPLVLARMKQPDECAAFRVKPGQFFDPPLHLPVGTQPEQRLGAPSVKALSDSRKHAFESSIR